MTSRLPSRLWIHPAAGPMIVLLLLVLFASVTTAVVLVEAL